MSVLVDWHSLSLQFVTTLAHFMWQGALIGLALPLVLHACSLRSANTRYLIACTAFALLPICVAVTFSVVHHHGEPIFVAQNDAEQRQPASLAALPRAEATEPPQFGPIEVVESEQSPLVPASHTDSVDPESEARSGSNRSALLSNSSPYLFGFYLFGVVAMLLHFACSMWSSDRLRRSLKPIEDSSIMRIIGEQSAWMELKHIPMAGVCDHVSVPAVVGILRPTVLLPPAILCGLDPQQLTAILRHEMAHIRRYDLLVNLLQRFIEALLFFHPVTWWISRRIGIERENCCDDLAVAGCGRLEFASALLQMAELCAKSRGLNIAPQLEVLAADGGNVSHLSRRIRRLLGEVDSPRPVANRSSVVVACVGGLVLGLSVLAFAQTDATSGEDTSNAETPQVDVYNAKQFARPPERYTHLMYDQSVVKESSRGLEPQRVIQRLPERGEWIKLLRQWDIRKAGDHLHGGGNSYATFRPGELVVVSGGSVVLRHAITGTETVLIRGSEIRSAPFSRKLARVAVSPSGRQVAAAIFKDADYEGLKSPLFDIHIIDLSGDVVESRVVGEGWHGDSILASALSPTAVAPPIFWADDATLLVATPGQRIVASRGWTELNANRDLNAAEIAKLGDVILVKGGEVLTPTHDLLRIDVNDGTTQKVCDLKLGVFMTSHATGTDFWRRSDGAIMLRSLGEDIRIDLADGKAVRDRKLSPYYELRGDRNRPSLWFGDQQLAEVLSHRDVGISPDGRSIAWYARTNPHDTSNLGSTSLFPTTLWFHTADAGKVELAAGRFALSENWDGFDNPVVNPRFFWLTDEDLRADASPIESDMEK